MSLQEKLDDYKAGMAKKAPKHNGDDSWTLPLPARYIIDRKGIVRYAEISDHQQAGGMRMAPARGRGHLCWWSLILRTIRCGLNLKIHSQP